jgi:hypothetical protein
MKKLMMTLIAMVSMTISAQAMSYEQAREQALFLTDKMAYELNLTEDQYEAAYEVNLDYLLGVESQADLYGDYWIRRNLDLSYILLDWQYNAFCAASYFYRPLYWDAGYWHFGIYARYPHRTYFYFGRPSFWYTYRGGHAWHRVGGRGWYHGRTFGRDHRIATNHRGFGMRNGFDRGDFRGRSGNFSPNNRDYNRGNRSIERGRSNGSFNRSDRNMNRGDRSIDRNRSNGSFNRGNRDINRSNGSIERSRSNSGGSFNRGNSTMRSRGNSDGVYNRMSSTRQANRLEIDRSSRSSNHSFSTNRSSMSRSSSIGRSSAPSRSSGSFSSGSHRSSGSFSSGGHIGGGSFGGGGHSHGGGHSGGHGGRR